MLELVSTDSIYTTKRSKTDRKLVNIIIITTDAKGNTQTERLDTKRTQVSTFAVDIVYVCYKNRCEIELIIFHIVLYYNDSE